MTSTTRKHGPTAIEILAMITAGISLVLLLTEKRVPEAIYFSWWQGLIWSLFFGLASGSYATSFTARLPRGIPTLGGRHPYCGSCNTPLSARDLFTVFSYLASGGKCRHCRAPIPRAVFATELATVLVFVLAWLRYETFGDLFLLMTSFGVCSVILGVVYVTDGMWLRSVALTSVIIALLYRSQQEASISAAVLFAATGFVIAVIGWRLSHPGALLDAKEPGDANLWQAWLAEPFSALAVLAFLWLPMTGALLFLLLLAGIRLVHERLRPGIALMALFMLTLFSPVFEPAVLQAMFR